MWTKQPESAAHNDGNQHDDGGTTCCHASLRYVIYSGAFDAGAVVRGDEDIGLATDLLLRVYSCHGLSYRLFFLCGEAHDRGSATAEPAGQRAGLHAAGTD